MGRFLLYDNFFWFCAYTKKAQMHDKPDSVLPRASRNHPGVASIINLHIVLPQNVKPSTRPHVWDTRQGPI